MAKRALLIGIRYLNDEANTLNGTWNDVEAIAEQLRSRFGYTEVTVMTDRRENKGTPRWPDFNNISKACQALCKAAKSGDSLFFGYAGHGDQITNRALVSRAIELRGTSWRVHPAILKAERHLADELQLGPLDTDYRPELKLVRAKGESLVQFAERQRLMAKQHDRSCVQHAHAALRVSPQLQANLGVGPLVRGGGGHDESDGKDEIILAVDFKRIRDDQLYDWLIKPLAKGARLRCFMDCCNSGSNLDLAFRWDPKKQQSSTENRQARKDADVLVITGCRDNQSSLEDKWNGKNHGALTSSFLRWLSVHSNENASSTTTETWLTVVSDLYRDLHEHLHIEDQIPQLGYCKADSLQVPFGL